MSLHHYSIQEVSRQLFAVAAAFLCSCLGLIADSTINQIIGLEAAPSYTQRHHALHQLPSHKLSANAQLLIDFMCAEQVPEGMEEAEYLSLVNDMYNLLLANGIEVQQLFDICLKVIPDESAGAIWRDYCMQKLGYTLGREDISAESIQQGLKLLDLATHGRYPSMQGTALIVAHQIVQGSFNPRPIFLNEGAIGQRALAAASNPEAPLIDRITALQIACVCRAEGTRELATKLLEEDAQDLVMLQVVAIASLGELGTAAALERLQQYRLSPDIRLRTASRVSIQRIQDRFYTNNTNELSEK